ncbi:cation-transporting P-type ATPase [Octadecabacter sp. G9-8]|uniref:Cation-transporting P-type ATPase n=1 Tax=Octadecabacter dasysiphoniae TaxID=2909341 RepID=A0ABS9CT31_9RHOB|nr:cation-transporting P-type ATPase [Octadecabacter dasysiphoniae]MCF2870400.1 cation-transporting P-type ATPase [Octadecabacter dasysiphoniae]
MADTFLQSGLTEAEVLASRHAHGWNELPAVKQPGPLRVLLRQFSSFLVLILIIAAVVALSLGERVDALAIGMVVLLNAGLGFVQEWKAETALSALRKMLSPQAMVLRDGREHVIAAKDVVPGDILILTPGTKIAADANVLRAADLFVDESVLTGESVPLAKGHPGQSGDVFAGTSVTAGRAEARVSATGAATEFGKIAHLTGSVGTKTTNLQNKLGHLARQLGIAALLVAGGVAGLGIWLGRDLTEMVMTGLSLSVAMVPEGLPAVVTITLALGATAMVRQNALARRLQAVETLGAASVICTDKTGTLTENKMTATQIWTLGRCYDVTGTGYDPAGHIEFDGERMRAGDDPVLRALLRTGLYCSHARLNRDGDVWHMVGAPTEGALITLGYKGWCALPQERNLLAERPFSSTRKRMSVVYQSGTTAEILTKGAPERILDICTHVMAQSGTRPLTKADQTRIQDAYAQLAQSGLRVMGFAQRSTSDHQIIEEDMTFLGLVGLIDPPRAEVRDAIAMAQSAGIRVVMITGDSPITAKAIAEQISLRVTHHLIGATLDKLDDRQLDDVLRGDILFARTKPEQKMRIVSALQAQGQIVAMTGDGVNDAPALKQADIGVSMGIRGTDVARDASDLVLLDDNFATIVRAIGEGRRQFANVQKFVRYLLSSNAGEVIALVISIALGGPLVFLATQILWMNLVTDGVTAVALGLEKSEPEQMQQRPRKKDTPILGLRGIVTILVLGTYTGLSSLWIFFHLMDMGVELARTTAFSAMVVFEKVSVFAFRSLHLTAWRIGWFSNPFLLVALTVTLGAQVLALYWGPLQMLLHTVPIGLDEWLLIAVFALPIIIVPEVFKAMHPRALAGKVISREAA